MFESPSAEIMTNEQSINIAEQNLLAEKPDRQDFICSLTGMMRAWGRPVENMPESENN